MNSWVLVVEQGEGDDFRRHVFGPYPDEAAARAAVDSAPVRAIVDRGLGVPVGTVAVPLSPP